MNCSSKLAEWVFDNCASTALERQHKSTEQSYSAHADNFLLCKYFRFLQTTWNSRILNN